MGHASQISLGGMGLHGGPDEALLSIGVAEDLTRTTSVP